jgi:hypothetical protein
MTGITSPLSITSLFQTYRPSRDSNFFPRATIHNKKHKSSLLSKNHAAGHIYPLAKTQTLDSSSRKRKAKG